MQDNPTQSIFPFSTAAMLDRPALILIVDDDQIVRSSMALVLERRGFAVQTVMGGRDALHYVADNPVALVITDIYMPDCDGLELILALHRLPDRPRIIAMTGSVNHYRTRTLHMARGLGADAELAKPFDGDVLFKLVRKILGETTPMVASMPSPLRLNNQKNH